MPNLCGEQSQSEFSGVTMFSLSKMLPVTALTLVSFLSLTIPLTKSAAVDNDETTEGPKTIEEEVAELKAMVAELARQAILNQLHLEERVRSEGDSGLKQVRHVWEGTKTYHSDTHSGYGFASIHDHYNNKHTLGMGETVAVINGLEFRTRHNDYAMVMPSDTSTEYGATVDIPFPDVPPEVLNKETIEEQIVEMHEWFKAFRDQDDSVRNFKNYFKPALCYMEGMWTYASEEVDESFESDRHHIDAKSWYELQSKIRYQAYTGAKDTNENLAYLPRIVMNVTEEGVPVYAQWNYNILCHPLKNKVDLDRLRVVDDLSTRMKERTTIEEYAKSHRARFQVNLYNTAFEEDGQYRHKFLDAMMYQIPGKDNYGQDLEDSGLEEEPYMEIDNTEETLNAAYYHRAHYVANKDAMGSQSRFRGFADENLYVAMTTQDKIAGMSITLCEEDDDTEEETCRVVHDKVSYAIPLEIIYMTPLSNWNPYNIPYKGDSWSDPEFKYVQNGGRNGNPGNAYNGSNSQIYHITPCEFYTDTSNCIAVLDGDGVERYTRPSGHHITLFDIPNVGRLRQRYPIAPIHADGSSIGKEVEALEDVVLDPVANSHLQYTQLNCSDGGGSEGDLIFQFETGPADAEFDGHIHSYSLTSTQVAELQNGNSLSVVTSQGNGHTHTLLLHSVDGAISSLEYITCDNLDLCWDGHPKEQIEV